MAAIAPQHTSTAAAAATATATAARNSSLTTNRNRLLSNREQLQRQLQPQPQPLLRQDHFDGLRAVAALLVFNTHFQHEFLRSWLNEQRLDLVMQPQNSLQNSASSSYNYSNSHSSVSPPRWLWPFQLFFDRAQIAVHIFFVLSGRVIATTLLTKTTVPSSAASASASLYSFGWRSSSSTTSRNKIKSSSSSGRGRLSSLNSALAKSLIKRPIRIIFPIIVAFSMHYFIFYSLGFYSSTSPPRKSIVSILDTNIYPHFSTPLWARDILLYTIDLFYYNITPPAGYQLWTLPVELINSIYLFLLAYFTTAWIVTPWKRLFCYASVWLLALSMHHWLFVFLTGMIVAEISLNTPYLTFIKSEPIVNTLFQVVLCVPIVIQLWNPEWALKDDLYTWLFWVPTTRDLWLHENATTKVLTNPFSHNATNSSSNNNAPSLSSSSSDPLMAIMDFNNLTLSSSSSYSYTFRHARATKDAAFYPYLTKTYLALAILLMLEVNSVWRRVLGSRWIARWGGARLSFGVYVLHLYIFRWVPSHIIIPLSKSIPEWTTPQIMSLVYIAILLVLIPYALLFYYIGDTASIVLGKHICQWLIQDESVLYDDYGRGGGSSSSMDDEGMDDEHVGEEDHFDDLPSPSSSGMELLPLFVNHAGARGSTKDQ